MALLTLNLNDRMAGRTGQTLRNIPKPKGIHEERPSVYPIFNIILQGETEGLCADGHTLSHTSGSWEASLRLISYIILLFEPRGLSAPHCTTLCTALTVLDAGGYTVVYPGVYRVVYSREGVYPPW